MNFYIGNSINEIDEQDVNVKFSDELIDFLIKIILKKQKSVGKMENKCINALDDLKSPMIQWHAIRGNEERLSIY